MDGDTEDNEEDDEQNVEEGVDALANDAGLSGLRLRFSGLQRLG